MEKEDQKGQSSISYMLNQDTQLSDYKSGKIAGLSELVNTQGDSRGISQKNANHLLFARKGL